MSNINAQERRCVHNRIKDVFKTTIRGLLPLPDPNAPSSSPAHPSSYNDLPVGARIAAIYPDTSSFYRGTVAQGPLTNGTGPKKGKYVVVFDDDGGRQTEVDYEFVIDVSCNLVVVLFYHDPSSISMSTIGDPVQRSALSHENRVLVRLYLTVSPLHAQIHEWKRFHVQ